jgi:hypothetical protein
VYPPIGARPRLSKQFSAANNTKATTEELLDAVFYMQSVLYGILSIWRKEGKDYFFPELIVSMIDVLFYSGGGSVNL